jgi:hypothetical protein
VVAGATSGGSQCNEGVKRVGSRGPRCALRLERKARAELAVGCSVDAVAVG